MSADAIGQRQIVSAQELHQTDREQLWPRTWHLACRVDQVAKVRDFAEYRIAGHSAFVIHTEMGLRAFLNRCPHRKARVIDGEGYCLTDQIICPLHGWRWHLDGSIKHVVQQHLMNDRHRPSENLDLVPCRFEVLGNAVYVNFDAYAPPLSQSALFYGVFPEQLGPVISITEVAATVELNWRAAMKGLKFELAGICLPGNGNMPNFMDEMTNTVGPAGMAHGDNPMSQIHDALRICQAWKPLAVHLLTNALVLADATKSVGLRVVAVSDRTSRVDFWCAEYSPKI